jgi:hypothetical protein
MPSGSNTRTTRTVTTMKVSEAIKRGSEMEQYDYCYCAGAADFEAIKLLVEVARKSELVASWLPHVYQTEKPQAARELERLRAVIRSDVSWVDGGGE